MMVAVVMTMTVPATLLAALAAALVFLVFVERNGFVCVHCLIPC
jgi:hypothetical protein